MNTPQKVIPPVLARYELKYVIPKELIEPISQFASVYCSLDKYSAVQKDFCYEIYVQYDVY